METRTRHPDLALSGAPGAIPEVAQPGGSSLDAPVAGIAPSSNGQREAPVASGSGPQRPSVADAVSSGAAPVSTAAATERISEQPGLAAAASPRPGHAERSLDQAAPSAAVPPDILPLLGMSLAELQAWCRSQGQPAFRAKQLHDWIYDRGVRSIEAITVLPKAWRQRLAASGSGIATSAPLVLDAGADAGELPAVGPSSAAVESGAMALSDGGAEAATPSALLKPAGSTVSPAGVPDAWIGRSRELLRSEARDGTVKLLLGTRDGLSLETVGIPSGDRLTVCVSSQVGCPMACRFCATGKGGLQRSLELHEIVDQVLTVREVMGRRPSHVVFMGMGEPLLNLEAVLATIDCLCTDLGMAQRQITVSTVGVPAALPTLAERALARLGRAQFTLAVSLHAPDQALRQRLIPTAHAYPIERLLEDCRTYVAITGRRVSFEYILLGGVNDQPRHAEALARLLRGFQSHVNLIPYNPIDEEDFRRPAPEAVEVFRRGLQERRIAVSVRASRGLDADAACGQLRRRQLEVQPVGSTPATAGAG
jgi:23S rRNA (adenine2503-C2)-methyltransferase